jgi:hypothetical protein
MPIPRLWGMGYHAMVAHTPYTGGLQWEPLRHVWLRLQASRTCPRVGYSHRPFAYAPTEKVEATQKSLRVGWIGAAHASAFGPWLDQFQARYLNSKPRSSNKLFLSNGSLRHILAYKDKNTKKVIVIKLSYY